MTLTKQEQKDALAFDPFASDFGDQGDRIFRDAIVVARKPHECVDCLEPINPGEQYRSMTAKFDGVLSTRGWCIGCLKAFAMRDDEGQADACEARFDIREQNLKAREAAVRA